MTISHFSHSRRSKASGPPGDRILVRAFLEQRAAARPIGSSATVASAARHFLHWTRRHNIPFEAVDDDVVSRFGRHRCNCRRYSRAQLRNPAYIAQIRRFVRFLEDEGVIVRPSDPVALDAQLVAFSNALLEQGFSRVTRLGRLAQARHFVSWLRLSRIPSTAIDDAVIDRFAVHHCRCGIRTKRGQLVKGTGTAHRRRGAQSFVAFLREHGLMLERTAEAVRLLDDARLMDFRNWLKRERGATDETVRRYVQEASRWLPALGTDPAAYETAAIRSIRMRIGGGSDDLFVVNHGHAPTTTRVYCVFVRIARQLGIRTLGSSGPRLHDLRHTFAVRSLEACAHDPRAVTRHMTALSTYLGHADIANTYWYLEATPILLNAIATATEQAFVGGGS